MLMLLKSCPAWMFLGVTLVLTGCADSGGRLGGSLKGRYVESSDITQMLSENVTPLPGSTALGVHANLVGSRSDVEACLNTATSLRGTIPVPAAQRYLEGIRDKLLAQWSREVPFSPPEVKVIASQIYNAEAVSTDSIEVSIGVITRARSEDEVAFVIGHELGHILLKHQIRRQNQLQTVENVADALDAIGMVAGIMATSKRSGTSYVARTGPAVIAMGSAFAGQTAVAEAITAVIDPGWSSRQEEQADLVSTDLMSAAGYNPEAAADAFASIEADEEAGRKKAADLQAEATEQRGHESLDLQIANFFDDALTGLKNSLNRLRANHPKTADRDRSLSDYRDHIYAAESDRKRTSAALVRLQKGSAVRAAVNAMRQLRDADHALENGDAAEALRSANAAHESAPNWWGPLYVAGLADRELGRSQAASNFLDRAIRTDGAPYEAFERYAFELVEQHRTAAAIAVLDSAAARFGGPDITEPDRIIVTRYAGDTADANRTLQACLNSASPRLRDSCERAHSRALEPV